MSIAVEHERFILTANELSGGVLLAVANTCQRNLVKSVSSGGRSCTGNMRRRPERPGEKLRQIRLALGLSQSEMLRRLDAEDLITYQQISRRESGKREPSLMILLQYARAAGVRMEKSRPTTNLIYRNVRRASRNNRRVGSLKDNPHDFRTTYCSHEPT